MITAEIDRLATADRRVLRYASVLGMSFDAALRRGAPGGGGGRESNASRGNGWRSSSTTRAAGRYRFRHALMRDAAYEGLPYRRRRELHARVGQRHPRVGRRRGPRTRRAALAALLPRGRLRSSVALLDDRRRAGRGCVREHRGLALLPPRDRCRPTPRRCRGRSSSRTNERLGDVLERAGLFDEAAKAYADARRQVDADRIAEARLILKQAKLADKAGKPTSSLRWLTRAMGLLDAATDHEAAVQRARVSATYSAVRAGQGRGVRRDPMGGARDRGGRGRRRAGGARERPLHDRVDQGEPGRAGSGLPFRARPLASSRSCRTSSDRETCSRTTARWPTGRAAGETRSSSMSGVESGRSGPAMP